MRSKTPPSDGGSDREPFDENSGASSVASPRMDRTLEYGGEDIGSSQGSAQSSQETTPSSTLHLPTPSEDTATRVRRGLAHQRSQRGNMDGTRS